MCIPVIDEGCYLFHSSLGLWFSYFSTKSGRNLGAVCMSLRIPPFRGAQFAVGYFPVFVPSQIKRTIPLRRTYTYFEQLMFTHKIPKVLSFSTFSGPAVVL